MIQLKEEKIKTIINADSSESIELIINNQIWDMLEDGILSDVIMEFIQKLELSLLLHNGKDDSFGQLKNVKVAREILMNKILNGIEAQYSF